MMEMEPEPEPYFPPPPPPPPPPRMAAPEPEPEMAADEDLLELTEDMVAADDDLVSGQTVQMSTDVLAELARAILDRRDLKITEGQSPTLESMVREMLKPILREWLDRNLPYLIERLVKKEIDRMITRAERLED